MPKIATLFFLMICVVGCTGRGQTPADLPTRIPSVDALATADIQTRNAPPVPFNNGIAFMMIDDNLPLLSNWRSEATLRFTGVFTGTSRGVEFEAGIFTWFNQSGNQRRTQVTGVGDLFGESSGTVLEGVRLGQRTFLVREGVCFDETQDRLTAVLADLRAGELLGGMRLATPGASKAVVNGEEVWRYDVVSEHILLPQVHLGELGSITRLSAEVWFSPRRNAVIRYYANIELENALITLFDATLPLTGQLFLRYDVYEIGENPNITIPTGC